MKNAVKAEPLNAAQLMVLQVVKDQHNEQDLEELRNLLLHFVDNKMQEHLDKAIAEKGYTPADFDNMLTAHSRKAR